MTNEKENQGKKRPTDEYKGSKYRVVHCKDALDSLNNAIKSVTKAKAILLQHNMSLQIERLANGRRLSENSFCKEGNLPKKQGQSKAKKFYAMKRIPLRAYCWLSNTHQKTYYISHYVFKNYQKLNKSDTAKVASNWRRIEENGDER